MESTLDPTGNLVGAIHTVPTCLAIGVMQKQPQITIMEEPQQLLQEHYIYGQYGTCCVQWSRADADKMEWYSLILSSENRKMPALNGHWSPVSRKSRTSEL